MNIKKIIKKIVPDKMIRFYRESKSFPKYLEIITKERGVKYPDIKFYTDKEMVDMIVNQKKSLSRFGDGEIKWMTHCKLDSFQEYSEELASGLKRAYLSENSNLLIGLPYAIVDSKRYSWGSRMHWRIIKSEFFDAIQELGKIDRIFCNASVTRPYIDFNDRKYSECCFNILKRIWNERNVIFVEGSKTKLGMGNDLFANTKSIRRILCPATNAYACIEEIKCAIREHAKEGDLILAALGPTATVLASDMCDEGYQVIDIGHIDVEYIWFLRHDILRNPIEGKYVNESGEKFQSNLYEDDEEYVDSIVARVM